MSRNQEGGRSLRRSITYAVIGLFALLAFNSAAYIVTAGHVGVVTRFGAITGNVAQPGLHFKVPFVESVHKFEVRVQKEQTQAAAASSDLQAVSSTIAVNYHISSTEAQSLYDELGADYKQRVIDPAVQEVFKSATAGFTAGELITRREEVKGRAFTLLKERMSRFHIVIDDLNVVNFDFSSEFNAAIEAKQVAQQEVEKARQELERAKVDAERRVTEAHAAAEAQRLQQLTLTPLIIQLEFLKKWNGTLPTYMGTDLNALFQVPTQQK